MMLLLLLLLCCYHCTSVSVECNAVGYSCSKNTSSWLPMKVALVGGDAYISAVLRPYVEFFSTKSPDWLTYVHFLIVPFGKCALSTDWEFLWKWVVSFGNMSKIVRPCIRELLIVSSVAL